MGRIVKGRQCRKKRSRPIGRKLVYIQKVDGKLTYKRTRLAFNFRGKGGSDTEGERDHLRKIRGEGK